MDSKEESLKLRSEFKDCQKMLTAIGDETRQHLIALMIMEKCSGARVVDIAKENEFVTTRSIPSYANPERCRVCLCT